MTAAPRRRTLALLTAGLLVLSVVMPVGAAAPDGGAAAPRAQTTKIQILGLNDFHGQLEPVPATSSGGRIGTTPAGGVEYLATHVRELRATNPNTLFVSAGDLIGATPLVSAVFHDEPTIEAFNAMALDYNGVGNHEFDEGVDELLRMQNGGCHPVDGCFGGDGFDGADFQFLAANVTYKDSGDTIFPPYAIHHFQGVKVAVIGMTLEGTPSIVSASGIASVDFHDEADSVNALVPVLRAQGIRTIIVLLHEGGTHFQPDGVTTVPINETTINSCVNPQGALPGVVERMSDEVDVVVTGHTNWAINCRIDGKIVTGAAATGRLITDIDLVVSRATKNVVSSTVNNTIVTQGVTKAADMTALVTEYKTLSAPAANRIIGKITADITTTSVAPSAGGNGESALGDVIADAQNFDAAAAGTGSQLAFMNAGGIRSNLLFANSPAGEAPGEVTYGEAFAVQPFGNSLVTMTLTGTQIKALLEKQFTGGNGILQVSDGFTYTMDPEAAADNRISNIALDGAPLVLADDYRVTVNSFLADGGDNFLILRDGTDRVAGNVDTDAFENYLAANPAGVAPGPRNRISVAP